jgi:hypothetical protein
MPTLVIAERQYDVVADDALGILMLALGAGLQHSLCVRNIPAFSRTAETTQ